MTPERRDPPGEPMCTHCGCIPCELLWSVCERCGYPPPIVPVGPEGRKVPVMIAPNDAPPPHVERRRCRCDPKATEAWAKLFTDREEIIQDGPRRRKNDAS